MSEVKSVVESYLDLASPLVVSDSVEFIEYRDVSAPKEQLNGVSKSITLNIDYTDEYVLLQKSYFVLKLDLVKTDDSKYADADEIAITNNGIMQLFSTAEFRIGGAEIERFSEPGIATTVTGMLKYNFGDSEVTGKEYGWFLDRDKFSAVSADNRGFEEVHY